MSPTSKLVYTSSLTEPDGIAPYWSSTVGLLKRGLYSSSKKNKKLLPLFCFLVISTQSVF